MTTVLFADRDGAAFGPLAARLVPALLPLRAKPLLEHAIEALAAAGEKTALVVVGPRGGEVERRFGKGIRWGIALEWLRREDDESPADVLRRIEARLDGAALTLRGDAGTHAAIPAFVAAARDAHEDALLASVKAGRFLGHVRVPAAALKKIRIPREPAAEGWAPPAGASPEECAEAAPLLDGLAAWRDADRAGAGVASERAVVEEEKSLGEGTTVGDEAVVLAGATLVRTAVLPRSVVPPRVRLEDRVLAGALVLDAATGSEGRLADLLPPARPWRAAASDRVLALAALLVSLPLWPVAFLWALVANAGHATSPVTFAGLAGGTNEAGGPARAPFTTFRFETAVPVLRDLPLLFAVLSGRLALAGVTPLAPDEEAAAANSADAALRARLEAPPGLLSTARLAAPGGALPEVLQALDAFDARRATGSLVARGLSAFFTARAWSAPKAWNPDVLPGGERPA